MRFDETEGQYLADAYSTRSSESIQSLKANLNLSHEKVSQLWSFASSSCGVEVRE